MISIFLLLPKYEHIINMISYVFLTCSTVPILAESSGSPGWFFLGFAKELESCRRPFLAIQLVQTHMAFSKIRVPQTIQHLALYHCIIVLVF